jgi:DNA-directed RNA polymerase delta subunit
MRVPGIITRPVGEELFMFSAEKWKYYALNEVAAAVWRRLEHPLSIDRLCEELQHDFQVSPEQCLEDISHYLEELYANGLIRVVYPNITEEEQA